MRMLNRLLLVAIAATAALAMTASTATAREAIEVFEEGTGTHCDTPQVRTGHMVNSGCHINVHGEPIELSGHVFGMETHVLSCENSFDIWIGEDGSGFVTGMVVDDGPLNAHDFACNNVRPCISEGTHGETHPSTEGNEAGEHVWPFEMEEIGGPNSEEYEAHVTACFHTGQAIEECEGQIDFHVYEEHPAAQPEQITEAETVLARSTTHAHGAAGLPESLENSFATHCEVNGHYDLRPEHELHITHLGA